MAMPSLIRKASHTLTLASPRIFSSVVIKPAGKSLNFSHQSTNFSTVAGKSKKKWTSDSCYVQMPEPPPDFPFTIEDIPGKDRIYLRRDFAGEKIIAEVYGPGRWASCVGLWLKVAKGDGAARLKISLSAYSDGFQTGQIIFQDQGKQNEDDRMDLHRENFWTEFVRVRGLGDPLGVFLFDYMTKRKDREHLLFLNKLDQFLMY